MFSLPSARWDCLLPLLALLAVPLSARSQHARPRVWTPEAAKHVSEIALQFDEAFGKKDYQKAAALGEELCRLDASPENHYNLACLYLRQGRTKDGLKKLQDTLSTAPNDPSFAVDELFEADPDLDPIRKRREFPALLKRAEAVRWKPARLEYETGNAKPVPFLRSTPDNPYLTSLRTRYNLDALTAGARGDLERVKILCTWVHTRWNHIGDAHNQPKDPIGLLEAASKGDNFRCVEYGVTVTGCLNAEEIPARVVYAQAQDVETRRSGAGHVFAEAYLRDQKRWVFVDPQTNVVGEADGQPLNTVEFQQAFSKPHPKIHYDLQLGSCFYYFSYDLDGRYPPETRQQGDILLIPKGAPTPRVFQRLYPLSYTMTTHNPADVYGPPPTTK